MKRGILLAFAGCLAAIFIAASMAYAGTTEIASKSSDGTVGNNTSYMPSISADGRYVAFESNASNLAPDDTNETADIFVHDRQTGKTEIISKDSKGNSANGGSRQPAVSADGRYVAFESKANNLVKGKMDGKNNIFVHDRQTGITQIISKGGDGGPANGDSVDSAISADGRFVAFSSAASNLVPEDTNGKWDVFVYDLQTETTELVSKDGDGNLGNKDSFEPAISADGRFAAFRSMADNLVPGDTNGANDIFVRDRQIGKTELVSKDSNGIQGYDSSISPAISADGRFVAFESSASNLVPDDANGKPDIFVHDKETGVTEIVSVDSNGKQTDGRSSLPSISADGRYIAFESANGNLVPTDTNDKPDAFVRDRQAGVTIIVSVDSKGNTGEGGGCFVPAISGSGRHVAFESDAGNLVPNDTNGVSDIFVNVLE